MAAGAAWPLEHAYIATLPLERQSRWSGMAAVAAGAARPLRARKAREAARPLERHGRWSGTAAGAARPLLNSFYFAFINVLKLRFIYICF